MFKWALEACNLQVQQSLSNRCLDVAPEKEAALLELLLPLPRRRETELPLRMELLGEATVILILVDGMAAPGFGLGDEHDVKGSISSGA